MSDISPWEFLNIWWIFINCIFIGPDDASQSDDEAKEGEGASREAIVSFLASA